MKTQFQKNQFKIVIERDRDGFFVASVPALPGCHTQAKTMAQLLERTRDAIRLCVSVAREDKKYAERMRRFAYEPSFIGIDVVSI